MSDSSRAYLVARNPEADKPSFSAREINAHKRLPANPDRSILRTDHRSRPRGDLNTDCVSPARTKTTPAVGGVVGAVQRPVPGGSSGRAAKPGGHSPQVSQPGALGDQHREGVRTRPNLGSNSQTPAAMTRR